MQKKPLELIKAIIVFGGKEVSEDRLTEALWHDAEGDLAHKSLENNLGRLRRLLGNERAIILREGRVTINPRYCWVDVRMLEHIMARVKSAWRDGRSPTNDDVALAEKAVGMYHGDLLAGEDDRGWAISSRETLKTAYLKVLNRLAGYWDGKGRTDKAIEYYAKGTEIDALAEESYMNLMLCYGKLGRELETYNCILY